MSYMQEVPVPPQRSPAMLVAAVAVVGRIVPEIPRLRIQDQVRRLSWAVAPVETPMRRPQVQGLDRNRPLVPAAAAAGLGQQLNRQAAMVTMGR